MVHVEDFNEERPMVAARILIGAAYSNDLKARCPGSRDEAVVEVVGTREVPLVIVCRRRRLRTHPAFSECMIRADEPKLLGNSARNDSLSHRATLQRNDVSRV
jgi:hypothetical protein